MERQKLFGNALLLLTAFIWGSAFVAQSIGMDHISTFTFTTLRSFIGGIALLPVVWLFTKNAKKRGIQKPQGKKYDLLIASFLSGLFLCIGTNLQQIGLIYTTASKAGFITALYIVLVPIFGIFLKKKIGLSVWISVLLATCGLYFLCMNESLSLNIGDFFVFCCAFAFSAQIMVVDHYIHRVDSIRLACNQLFVCGALALVPMLVLEVPSWEAINNAWLPILYAGVLSSGVAYTLQIFGQRYTEPAVASLLMSFESVFAAISGFVVLHELLSGRELFGCVLMFLAIILAQLPSKKSANIL